jgi:hypothetical protein
MEKQFIEYLESIGFINHGGLLTAPLIPTYYRTEKGDHFIASAIHVCLFASSIHVRLFAGVDTKIGDLGCVMFYYHGKHKEYRCRNVNDSPEMLKKVFCPKSADEAIQTYKEWSKDCQNFIKARWKEVL